MRHVKLGIAAIGVIAALGLHPDTSSGSPPASRVPSSGYNVIYSFKGAPDGAGPMSDLTMDAAGNLYGTTSSGGTGTACNGGCGTVVELKPTSKGWDEQVLYSFTAGTDGIDPEAGVIFDSSGNLFGTTAEGGSDQVGTVFELTPTQNGGWRETVIYSFSYYGSAGQNPKFDL